MANNVQDEDGRMIETKPKGRFQCESFAQGTGFSLVPGSSTPVDRFVRAAMMTNFAFQPKDSDEATTLAFHILNTVDIPKGTSRGYGESSIHDFTQWATVSNLQQKTYSIRMYNSPLVFKVDLKALNLEELKNYEQTIPVAKKSIDITERIVMKK